MSASAPGAPANSNTAPQIRVDTFTFIETDTAQLIFVNDQQVSLLDASRMLRTRIERGRILIMPRHETAAGDLTLGDQGQ